MRNKELKIFALPYENENLNTLDLRFDSAIGADVPSAGILVEEILNDLDPQDYGIKWWKSLPGEERALIGDYLYQAASSIQVNLSEAMLHLFEWLSAKQKSDERMADSIIRLGYGSFNVKMPKAAKPADDLAHRLEGMHIAGFLRAIGSSLDCLAATVIAVLGLSTSLRRSDIRKMEQVLKKVESSPDLGVKVVVEFREFFDECKELSGPKDWLEWADQYRNTFVHRGRRTSFHKIVPREPPIYDGNGNHVPRTDTVTHLAKYPDRTDVEALIKGSDLNLLESAETTLRGIFASSRELIEQSCEQLLRIWKLRRSTPSLIVQPSIQWDNKIRSCDFFGFDPITIPDDEDRDGKFMLGHPTMRKRMLASAATDDRRNFWASSKWF